MNPAGAMLLSVSLLLLIGPLTALLTQTAPAASHDTCDKARNIYGNTNTEFVNCAVQHSEPVTFCVQCVPHFINTMITWQALSDTHQPNDNSTSCLDLFVNQDRLNLLLAVRDQSLELWNSAACSSKFYYL